MAEAGLPSRIAVMMADGLLLELNRGRSNGLCRYDTDRGGLAATSHAEKTIEIASLAGRRVTFASAREYVGSVRGGSQTAF